MLKLTLQFFKKILKHTLFASTWSAFPAAAAAAAAAATAAGLARLGCCIADIDALVERSVARPGCIAADTVDVGEEEEAEFMTAAAAAAAAAWAAAAGVVPLGRGLAEAAGISITGERNTTS